MYKILQSASPINEVQLNTLAKTGWVFITTVPYKGGYYHYFRLVT